MKKASRSRRTPRKSIHPSHSSVIGGLPPLENSSLSFFNLPPPPVLTENSGIMDYMKFGALSLHQQIQFLNNSKIFAGLVVIILNIAGKFVNFKLSKTMESYMRHTFSRNILVFCIAWMGSREIYVAIIITILCIILMDFVCNENSGYCMLPENFQTYHMSLLEKREPTEEDIINAKDVLKRASESTAI